MDKFTETSYTSYGQNIGNSFKGIFIGILLIVGSIILLWWNEGRSVEQATALQEMQSKITTLSAPNYDSAQEGKAILIQGEVKPLSEVIDPEFNVKTDGLSLRRQVEMYQWKEHEKSTSKDKLGGGTETVTTYEYARTWSSNAIDSSSFKHPMNHENPSMNYKSESFNTDAMLGDFYLDRSVVSYIGASKTYAGLNTMPNQVGVAHNYKSYLYIGMNPSTPMVGDIKITYKYAPAGLYTFAGKEEGKKLIHYETSNGKSFIFARNGRVSAQTIFKEEFDANATLTWILRGVGLVLMFIGFTMFMGLIATLAKVIPMLGSLASGVTSIVAGIFTLILGSFVIALAWFSSRPIMSLIIIAVGVGIAFALGIFGKKKQTGFAPQGTPATSTSSSEKEDVVNTAPPRREDSSEDDSKGMTPPPRKR